MDQFRAKLNTYEVQIKDLNNEKLDELYSLKEAIEQLVVLNQEIVGLFSLFDGDNLTEKHSYLMQGEVFSE